MPYGFSPWTPYLLIFEEIFISLMEQKLTTGFSISIRKKHEQSSNSRNKPKSHSLAWSFNKHWFITSAQIVQWACELPLILYHFLALHKADSNLNIIWISCTFLGKTALWIIILHSGKQCDEHSRIKCIRKINTPFVVKTIIFSTDLDNSRICISACSHTSFYLLCRDSFSIFFWTTPSRD